MSADTFRFGRLGFSFFLFLLVFGALIGVTICLALLAFGLAIRLFAADLFGGLAVCPFLLRRPVIVIVTVVVHLRIAILVGLSSFFFSRLFPGTFPCLSRFLLALGFLPLDI